MQDSVNQPPMTTKGSIYDALGRRKYTNTKENRRFLRTLETLGLPLDRYTFCRTIYDTGCRTSEALELDIERLEPETNIVRFRTLKQGKDQQGNEIIRFRRVPVPGDLMSLLWDIALLSEDGKIWHFSRVTAWKTLKSVMTAAKIEGIQANGRGLRHGYGTRGMALGIPLPVIQELLGHASIQTTSIYLHTQDEQLQRWVSRMW